MNIDQAKNSYSTFTNLPLRLGQQEAIEFIINSPKKVVVICASTGSGKSLVGMVAGQLLTNNGNKGKFCYTASSRQLQSQLMKEFPECAKMQGRQNFPCLANKGLTARFCINSKRYPCEYKHSCPYKKHKLDVSQHSKQILNYHYFLTEANYVGTFTDYPIFIADEADMLESILTEFIGLTITQGTLNKLGVEPMKYKTACENGIAEWIKWSQDVVPVIQNKLDELEFMLDPKTPDAQTLEGIEKLTDIETRIRTFIDNVDESWILDKTEKHNKIVEWKFVPTWITNKLSRSNFFCHMDKVVLMSATFPPKNIISKTLGIDMDDIDYMEVPSTFPIENRRVYLDPAANMSYKTIEDELDGMIDHIDGILKLHPKEKGLIHTVSWKLNEAIMEIRDDRLLTHTAKDKDAVLKQFMESKDPLVFVSPSSTRGLDLPDDLCRFIIMPKAPFKSLASDFVSSRVWGSQIGSWWYRSLCAQEIVQACGRAVRHKNDWAISYLLDKQICDMVTDNQSLFPKYWLGAVDVI